MRPRPRIGGLIRQGGAQLRAVAALPGGIVEFNRTLAALSQTVAQLDRLIPTLERLEQSQVEMAATAASLKRVVTSLDERVAVVVEGPGAAVGDGPVGSGADQVEGSDLPSTGPAGEVPAGAEPVGDAPWGPPPTGAPQSGSGGRPARAGARTEEQRSWRA